MVLAATGPSSAAGATMKSASQSNTPAGTGPRGPTGPSTSQPRSSPVGGAPGSVSRTSGSGGLGQGGQSSGIGSGYGGPSGPNGPNSGPSTGSVGGGYKGSTTSQIGSAASAQRASAQAQGQMGYKGGPPNAAAARASAALNAGLGRPTAGALNTSQSIGVGSGVVRSPSGAALGSFRTATEPVVRDYLSRSSPVGSPMQQSDGVLRAAGITNPSARAGILGTFDHESAGFNPNAVGDQGTAYGLGQWRNDRQQGLRSYASGLGMAVDDPQVQTAYAMSEMARSYPNTLEALKEANTVKAAVAAMNTYERPRGYVAGGDPTKVAGWNDRIFRSNNALAKLSQPVSAPVQSANAAEEMVRRDWVNRQIGSLYADPAINTQLPNALGQGMWNLRVSDATRLAQGLEPEGAFGERQLAPWGGAGFRTAEQAADNKKRGTGVGIDRTFHAVGLAADITVPKLPGETNKEWENRNAIANASLSKAIDPSTGVTWGGNWSKPDLSHFQLGSGSERAAAVEKYGSNVTTPGVRPDNTVADTRALSASVGAGAGLLDSIRQTMAPQTDLFTKTNLEVPQTSVPSWYQSDYTGRPTNTTTNVPSNRQSTYTGRPTMVPSNQQSTYTGPVTPSSTPIDGVMKDEAYSYPVKPYGKARQKTIDAAVGVLPVIGQINTGLGALGYSAGNIFVDEENKLANMTPEQRERYRSYWSDKRANAPGRGDESRGSRTDSKALNAYREATNVTGKRSSKPKDASGSWEADAKAYGYSAEQLKDPETRPLIKQLWDMGFIPKKAPAA